MKIPPLTDIGNPDDGVRVTRSVESQWGRGGIFVDEKLVGEQYVVLIGVPATQDRASGRPLDVRHDAVPVLVEQTPYWRVDSIHLAIVVRTFKIERPRATGVARQEPWQFIFVDRPVSIRIVHSN